MDTMQGERELRSLWAEGRWTDALSLVSSWLNCLQGPLKGWAHSQAACSLYAQSADNVDACLRHTDAALPLLVEEPEMEVKALLYGVAFAQYAQDTEREERYAKRLLALSRDPDVSVEKWLGRIYSTLAFYYEKRNSLAAARGMTLASVRWHRVHVGPFHEEDRKHQLALALITLADLQANERSNRHLCELYREALSCIDESRHPAMVHFVIGRMAMLDGDKARAIREYQCAVDKSGDGPHKLIHQRALESLAELVAEEKREEMIERVLYPAIEEAHRSRAYRLVMRLRRLLEGEDGGEYRGWRAEWLSFSCP